MTNIDKKQMGLLKTLGTALSAVGEVCKQIAESYDITVPAPPARDVNAPPKPVMSKKSPKPMAGKRLLKAPKRKANDDDHDAVKALRKATGKKAWSEARDTLCKERGLTRRQVNGILMTIGQDQASVTAATSKKRVPTKLKRVVTEIDTHAVLKLRKETNDKAWPAARDALCKRSGLTRKQIGSILGVANKRKNGIRVGRPPLKAANKR